MRAHPDAKAIGLVTSAGISALLRNQLPRNRAVPAAPNRFGTSGGQSCDRLEED